MKTSHLLVELLGLFAATALVACSTVPDEPPSTPPDEAVAEAEQAASRGGKYFIVTHPDYRKCAYPFCGGWFVKQVNRRSTECAGGNDAMECHAADLDLSMIHLSDDVAAKFEAAFGSGQALVRGRLKLVDDGYGHMVDTLVATEAWLGQAGSTPTGGFFGLTDSGIVCITYPCPSLHETLLNTKLGQNIHGVDLAASGASEKSVENGLIELYNTGILVAGTHGIVTGPAGVGQSLTASEFYLRVQASEGEVCGDAICGAGTYCCNASCSICAPEGGGCIQIVCQ